MEDLLASAVPMSSAIETYEPRPAHPTPRLVGGADDAAAEVSPTQVLEALLFAADTPLSPGRLAELIGVGSARDVETWLAQLNEFYEQHGRAFRIEAVAGGYQLLSLSAMRPWIAKLNRQRGETRLSDAALETLSIVAYRQPIIRADIESIRGVASGEVLNRLKEMGLIRIAGRAEVVGRPILYATTRKFLDVFGLANLDELPPLEALRLRAAATQPPEDAPATAESRAVAGA